MKRNYDSFSYMNIPEYYVILANSIKENKIKDFVMISNDDADDIDCDNMVLYFNHILNGYVNNISKDSISIEYYYNDILYKIALYYNESLKIYKINFIKIN